MRPALFGSKTMKTSFIRYSMGILAAGLLLPACGGDIQGTCLVQRRGLGGYGVVFDRQGPATGGGTCDTTLPARLGDIWTFDKYLPEQTDLFMRPLSLTARELDTSGSQDFLGESLDPDHPDLASAKIGASPDASGICAVPSMSEVRQDVVFELVDDTDPENPIDLGPEPANPRSITVTSLKFLSSAQFQGSQFETAATYTNGSCSASYTGIGITPLVSCASDADCNPFADPAAGRATGSGINPAYPVTCNTEVGALFPVRFDAVTGTISTDQGDAPGVCWLTGNTFPVLQ
jgi:hypothetical protein